MDVASSSPAEAEHGRFLIAPEAVEPTVIRCYRDGTLFLETRFETDGGGC